MLTIACVLKSGGIYDATWVARLKAGVERHLPEKHRFVCFSDVDVPCSRVPLEHGWPGWWSKLEAFKMPGPLLYFDLDTAIVGDLTAIAHAARTAPFSILQDFYRPEGLGSGVMAWSGSFAHGAAYWGFSKAADHWMNQFRAGGDQAFLEHILPEQTIYRWQETCVGQIVSYKVHCRRGIPENARVVCLHGKPKFMDMGANDPVRLAWEAA